MPRTRPAYPPEFREQIVALHRTGRSVEELAAEFEPSRQTIKNWIRAAGRGGGAAPAAPLAALDDAEREELRRLRREVKQLKQERDILAKAAAWFAQSDATSPRSSSS
jgi:transposase